MSLQINLMLLRILLQHFKIVIVIDSQVKAQFSKHLIMEVILIDLAILLNSIKANQEQFSQMK